MHGAVALHPILHTKGTAAAYGCALLIAVGMRPPRIHTIRPGEGFPPPLRPDPNRGTPHEGLLWGDDKTATLTQKGSVSRSAFRRLSRGGSQRTSWFG